MDLAEEDGNFPGEEGFDVNVVVGQYLVEADPNSSSKFVLTNRVKEETTLVKLTKDF